MKQFKRFSLLMLTVLFLTGLASNAMAWVSAACDPIGNQAQLSYSIGGIGQTPIDSDDPGTGASGDATTFYVGTLVDLDMSVVTTPVTATGADNILTFKIDNLGNDTQRYGLQLFEGIDTTDDDFDMTNVRVYTDTDSNYGNGGTTLIDGDVITTGFGVTLGTTADVAASGTIYVHVVSDVPAGQAALDEADYSLKALTYQIDAAGYNGSDGNQGTETGNSAVDSTSNNCAIGGDTGVVPVDGDADGAFTAVGGVTDGSNDGDYFATGTYVVSTATVTVEKTATVLWDPVNGNTNAVAIPGAYIQYVVTVANAAGAGASATLTTITDTLQAGNLAIDPNLITGGDLTPADGPYENAAGDGFKIVVSGSTRANNAADQFFTTATADGVQHVAGVITATFATILPAEAGPGYTAGELKPGESVALTFNAIIQ